MAEKRFILLLLLVATTMAISPAGKCQPGFPLPTKPPPQDLLLTDEEIAKSDALSNFAWGFFLQLDRDIGPQYYQQFFVDALRIHPSSRVILQHLITPWMIKKDYRSIIDNLLPIARENPTALDLQLIVTGALKSLNEFDQAADLLEHAYYQAEVRSPRFLRELAALYWHLERTNELEKLLQHARRDRELRHHFALFYVLTEYHQARWQQELKATEGRGNRRARKHRKAMLRTAHAAVAKLDETDASPADVDNLVQALAALEAWEQALELLDRARLGYPELQTAFDLQTAKVQAQAGRDQAAVETLLDINLESIQNPLALLELGRQLVELKQLADAAKTFAYLLKVAPNLERVKLTLGYIWMQLGKPEEARKLLAADIAQLPPTGLLLLSQASAAMDEFKTAVLYLQNAEEAARQAGEKNFFNVPYYVFAASVHEEAGDFNKAVENISKALALAPDDPVVNNFLGYILADHDQELERAEALIRKALANDGDNVAFLDSLAWVFYRQGRYADALREINRTLRLSPAPPDPVILDHAGDIHAANGYQLLAASLWWQASTDASHDEKPRIQEKLQKIMTQLGIN